MSLVVELSRVDVDAEWAPSDGMMEEVVPESDWPRADSRWDDEGDWDDDDDWEDDDDEDRGDDEDDEDEENW